MKIVKKMYTSGWAGDLFCEFGLVLSANTGVHIEHYG